LTHHELLAVFLEGWLLIRYKEADRLVRVFTILAAKEVQENNAVTENAKFDGRMKQSVERHLDEDTTLASN